MPGTAGGAAHVLLVHPAVHHPQGEQIRHRARPGRGRRRRGEVLPGQRAQPRQPLAGHLEELGQHQRARPGTADVHADLVGLAHLVLHVWQLTRFVLGSGPAQRPGLVVHQVGEVILDGPPRAAGRQVPLSGRQARAQLVNR